MKQSLTQWWSPRKQRIASPGTPLNSCMFPQMTPGDYLNIHEYIRQFLCFCAILPAISGVMSDLLQIQLKLQKSALTWLPFPLTSGVESSTGTGGTSAVPPTGGVSFDALKMVFHGAFLDPDPLLRPRPLPVHNHHKSMPFIKEPQLATPLENLLYILYIPCSSLAHTWPQSRTAHHTWNNTLHSTSLTSILQSFQAFYMHHKYYIQFPILPYNHTYILHLHGT